MQYISGIANWQFLQLDVFVQIFKYLSIEIVKLDSVFFNNSVEVICSDFSNTFLHEKGCTYKTYSYTFVIYMQVLQKLRVRETLTVVLELKYAFFL